MTDVRLSAADLIGNASRMTSQVERETMPAATLNKAMLAIVADSIEISFTRFGGNLWKYESSASRPTLAPLTSERSAVGAGLEDTSWKSFFDKLIQGLPSDVAARLLKERELVREERNESYTALDNVLVGTAKAIALIESASKPDSPNSAAHLHALAVSLMESAAETNISIIGKDFLTEAAKYLDSVGSNYSHHDKLMNNLKQTESALNLMQTYQKERA